MARRIPRRALALVAAALGTAAAVFAQAEPVAADAAPVLFRFSFDDDAAVTGPDTIAVFEHARGRVRLSREMVRSGWHALQLTDVAGDGDFPELQAYFPPRRAGKLTLSFALLVTDPREELNVALAGPAGFTLGRDGIALWLATRDGYLTHVSDSIPRRIAPLRPFAWYGVEAVYDLARGRYSLRLHEEGAPAPVVVLDEQASAASQPGSAVSVASFIGDNGDDLSNVAYFVDDVQLASDPAPALPPFVAPGRRKLFVELAEGYGEPLGAAPTCPPALALDDFALPADERGAAAVGQLLAAATGAPGKSGGTAVRARDLEAVRRWREGCSALARSDFEGAIRELRAALAAVPGAFLYRAALATALLGAAHLDDAAAIAAELEGERRDDPRTATLAARLAAARGFAGDAESLLREAVAGAGPGALEATAAGAFHWLMREGRAPEAEAFAIRMTERYAAPAPRALRARWLERRGDAAFAADEAARAGELYRAARALDAARAGVLDLKLADVAFVAGDLEAERALRERIYGALREAD